MVKEISSLVDKLLKGDRAAAARLISIVEGGGRAAATVMRSIRRRPSRAYVVGVTGPFGVGKSTLLDAIVKMYRMRGLKVGVVAVDPSSKISGGALLGDRIRLISNIGDEGVFFRSLSNRGNLGGLSKCTGDVVRILDAYGSDLIVIETVGAGQSDVDVAKLAHTTLVVLTPAIGDEIQLMKSGLIEIADIFVVNKADLPDADLMEEMLKLSMPKDGWVRPVIKTIAKVGVGVQEVVESIDKHRKYIESKISPRGS
ncbi:methylmalonyl Co-A mutase-associated GTPase MeaB [Candidatus Bathyarchaeota archaeon]|nr:methylmalonyl Co-A mutase-associated GTPase MeaB [Candidatus Bathyarchaeota archaeon]